MHEVLVGEVRHYFSKVGVAVLDLTGPLHEGDTVHIVGHTTDIEEPVESMEVEHRHIDVAMPGDDVALKAVGKVREGDRV